MTEYEKSQVRLLVQNKIKELEKFHDEWYNDDDDDFSPSLSLSLKINEYKTILQKLK